MAAQNNHDLKRVQGQEITLSACTANQSNYFQYKPVFPLWIYKT